MCTRLSAPDYGLKTKGTPAKTSLLFVSILRKSSCDEIRWFAEKEHEWKLSLTVAEGSSLLLSEIADMFLLKGTKIDKIESWLKMNGDTGKSQLLDLLWVAWGSTQDRCCAQLYLVLAGQQNLGLASVHHKSCVCTICMSNLEVLALNGCYIRLCYDDVFWTFHSATRWTFVCSPLQIVPNGLHFKRSGHLKPVCYLNGANSTFDWYEQQPFFLRRLAYWCEAYHQNNGFNTCHPALRQ